jgi:nucleotide-binding universal stress UspA family protein
VKRILVPLDGSRLSESVLPLAEALARAWGAEVFLLQALRGHDSVDLEAEQQAAAEAYLAHVEEAVRGAGVAAVRSTVWYDRPEKAIVDAVAAERAELVAMTTHGRSGVARLLLGSVAEQVVRASPVPVVLVRGEPAWTAGPGGTVLVPLDGSELAEDVLPVVQELAGRFDLAVALVRAVEPVPSPAVAGVPLHVEEMIRLQTAEAEEHLARTASRLEAAGCRVRCSVRVGPAAATIWEAAQVQRAGLIAMTTHGRTGVARLLLGSVAESLLRTATVPVLLWRPPSGSGPAA